MHTHIELLLTGLKREQGERFAQEAEQRIKDMERRFNCHDMKSPLAVLNSRAAAESVEVDDELFMALELCEVFRVATRGYFSVATNTAGVEHTPYILYAENGFDGTLSGDVDASKYSEVVTDGYLCGAVAAQEIGGGNGYYVMQNKGEGVMFYSVDDTTFSIPAGKCWLALPAALQGSASFRLDGTTGIDEVKGESGKVKTIYDLTGRKVENPAKGIYIINGNKVLVK